MTAAARAQGIGYGSEMSFTTSGIPPSVSTGNATSVTTNSATLNGTLTNLGASRQCQRFLPVWNSARGAVSQLYCAPGHDVARPVHGQPDRLERQYYLLLQGSRVQPPRRAAATEVR